MINCRYFTLKNRSKKLFCLISEVKNFKRRIIGKFSILNKFKIKECK